MIEVARESYALTLYTLWQLEQLHAFQVFERQLALHDFASLVAVSYHDPKHLERVTQSFLARYRPALTEEERAREATRVSDLLAAVDAAADRLVPVDDLVGA